MASRQYQIQIGSDLVELRVLVQTPVAAEMHAVQNFSSLALLQFHHAGGSRVALPRLRQVRPPRFNEVCKKDPSVQSNARLEKGALMIIAKLLRFPADLPRFLCLRRT